MITSNIQKKRLPSINEYDSLSTNPFLIDDKLNRFVTYHTDPKYRPGVAVGDDGVEMKDLHVKPNAEWETKDITEFTKLFTFEQIRHLGQPAQNILYFIFHHLQKGNDFICLPVQIVLEFCGYSSRITYYIGLKELLANKILSPKTSTIKNEYWINPNIFFKGDRVPLFKEQRKHW